jgi:uncharacterized protein YaaQ
MKLVVAIVQDYDTDSLLRSITVAGMSATRIASTGGFLRTGNTTVLMGVPDDAVPRCLALVTECCQARVQRVADEEFLDVTEWAAPGIVEVRIGGAAVFVLNVSRFERLERLPGDADVV